MTTSTETYKNCQSCGMPMSKDAGGGGTEANGSKSGTYCSKCYKKGAFCNPNMTVTQMQELVLGKLKEMGFPRFIGKLFTGGIPKLKRWRK